MAHEERTEPSVADLGRDRLERDPAYERLRSQGPVTRVRLPDGGGGRPVTGRESASAS